MDPDPNPTEEDEEEQRTEEASESILTPSFPLGRVKKIVKLDQEVKKITSEALLLISISADLFLASLTEGAGEAAIGKKKKVVKLEHIRSAARGHAPTSDFLLDCLPNPEQPLPAEKRRSSGRSAAPAEEKPLPPGARRIDDFFKKPKVAAAESVD